MNLAYLVSRGLALEFDLEAPFWPCALWEWTGDDNWKRRPVTDATPDADVARYFKALETWASPALLRERDPVKVKNLRLSPEPSAWLRHPVFLDQVLAELGSEPVRAREAELAAAAPGVKVLPAPEVVRMVEAGLPAMAALLQQVRAREGT